MVDLASQQMEIRAELKARMARVLQHGKYVRGPEVGELEERLSEFTGAEHCITCGSGTDALQLALMALDVGPGDEVVVPGFGFIAPAEVVALLGAKPVYVDVEAHSFNVNAAHLQAAITSRTKAILCLSLFGQCADYRAINAVATRFDLPVVEDAAQSLGASQHGARSGNLTTLGCTSFFPSKPLGCYGDGGAVFTNDALLAKTVGQLANHGQSRRYCHARVGINSRLDSLQAAVLLAKLSVFESELRVRSAIAEQYTQQLAGSNCATPALAGGNVSAWAQYTLLVDDREGVSCRVREQGVSTAIHYPLPLYRQRAVAEAVELPVCESLSKRVLSVPLHPYLSNAEVQRVCTAVRSALGD